MMQVRLFTSFSAPQLANDINRWLERDRVDACSISFDSESSGHSTVHRALVLYNKV